MSDGFWKLAEREPSREALVEPDGSILTRGDIASASNRLVHALRARGLRRGSVIAVAMKNQRAFVEIALAATQAGFYLVPINVRLASREVAYILQNSETAAVFLDASTEAVVRAGISEIGFAPDACFMSRGGEPAGDFRTVGELTDGHGATLPDDRSAGEVMFYTSGTTGLPKAVRRPLRDDSPENVAVTAARLRLAGVGLSPRFEAVHLVVSPLYHSAALAWCLAHLHLGHKVALMDEWSSEGMLDRVARHRVTGSLMVPTHFRRLLGLPDDVRERYDVSSLRHIVHGGAPCPVELKKRMMAWWGPVIYEVYGAAEAAGGTSVGPKEWLERPGTVGKVRRGEIRILREDGTDAAPREVGTVYFDSRGHHFEYLKDREKTNASRLGDLFTVGDVGYLDEDGYLFLSDRKADVIISGGVNIYPAEVEALLGEHPKVADVAVFGVPDDEWGEQVKAVVEPIALTEAGDELARELIAFCRDRIAHYKCPRSVDFMERLPRDPNGKLYKRRLRDPYWAKREGKI